MDFLVSKSGNTELHICIDVHVHTVLGRVPRPLTYEQRGPGKRQTVPTNAQSFNRKGFNKEQHNSIYTLI